MLLGEPMAQANRALMRPGKGHHVIARVVTNGCAQLIVSGEVSLEQTDAPEAARYPGIALQLLVARVTPPSFVPLLRATGGQHASAPRHGWAQA